MNSPLQKKILIVAESIDVEDSSGSKANVGLIQNLHEAGFEVLVYHYTRKNIQLKNIECVAIKERRANLLFLLSRIQRKIQHSFKINLAKHLEPLFGFSFTFFNDSTGIIKGLKNINFEPSLVITLSKGASFRPHHALLQLPEFHNKWLAYIHDPYPFHCYPKPYTWNEPGYKKKIAFFEDVAARCRWAGYPSKLLGEWMESQFKNFRNKRVIIPHQLNLRKKINIDLPEWFDPSGFNLLHAGNLMKQRDPLPLIKAFTKFLNEIPESKTNARLLLLGNASYHHDILTKMNQEIEELFVSEGYVAYEVVLRLQKEASVNIILESVAEVSPFLPGKFPHCIVANKPILHLGPEKSEVRRLLGEDYHYWAEADDISLISLKIKELYLKWKTDSDSLKLERQELVKYLSAGYLKDQINKLF